MRKHFPLYLIVWVVIVAGAFLLNVYVLCKNTEDLVQNYSEVFYKVVVTVRQWNADHGTIYVPLTETMHPNPYLSHNHRDVVTSDGDSLTMANPAFMTQKLVEFTEKIQVTKFHTAGLKPISPESKPDEWETKALQTFRDPNDRFFEKIKSGDSIRFRYMAPLYANESCLTCHKAQNFKIGDLMGGISFNKSYYNDHLTYNSALSRRLIIIYSLILFVGFFLIMYIVSFTQKRHLAIETKHKELQNLNVAKDKFINIIAHDLKTPAANIEALSETLSKKFDDLSEEERKSCIDLLVESAKTHTKLLQTLLDLSRLRLGSQLYHQERLDTRKITTEVLEQTKLQAQQKQINLKNNAGECFVNADKNMITTVMRNLVVNGIKFTHSGGQVTIQTEKKDDKVIISVTDTGVGIPDAKKDCIFGMDSSKSTVGTANETGTGLGLLLCKEYVERHGGNIWLTSELEKGTTFYFTLPEF